MVEDAVLEMAVVDVVVVGLPMSRRSLMKPRAQKRRHGDDGDASRQSSWKGGDAEVDAVRAVEDVGEKRRCNRGRRDGNGRVDAEVDAVKPPEPRRVPGLPDPATRRGRKHAPVLPVPDVQGRGPQPGVVVLDEEGAVRERTLLPEGEQSGRTLWREGEQS